MINLAIAYRKSDVMVASKKDKTVLKPLAEFIEGYMEKSRRSIEYKRMYLMAAKHLKGFGGYLGKEVYTNDMSEETLEEFVYFLQEQGNLMSSTVKGMIERR